VPFGEGGVAVERDPHRWSLLAIGVLAVVAVSLAVWEFSPGQQQERRNAGLVEAPRSRELPATFEGHTGEVRCVAFSPDGKTIASGSADDSIKFWDVATGRNTATLKEEDPYLWCSVAFSPDGKALATGGWFNKVKLWDVDALKGALLLNEKYQCPPPLVVFSPDGKTLASGGVCRGEMKLFDVASGKIKATLVTWEGANAEGVLGMAFTPDSKTLASVGRPDEIRLWDIATGKNTATLTIDPFAFSAAFSSDGKTLATAVWVHLGGRYVARDVKLWAVATGKEQMTLRGHKHDVLTLAFSPDSKTLAGGSEDGTITLWDVATGKELVTLKGHTGTVSSLGFSADCRMLVSGSEDKTIKLWDVPTGK
jgi:WD40 repeat protein